MQTVFKTISYKGKDYKAVFNLNVMEQIQDKYGSVAKWGELTDGGSGEVDVSALIFGFELMLNEGIEIENEDTGKNEPLLNHKQVGRLISEAGVKASAETVNNLVIESTKDDTDNSKNA